VEAVTRKGLLAAAATVAFTSAYWIAWRLLTPPLQEWLSPVAITLVCQGADLAVSLLAVALFRRWRTLVPLRWPTLRTALVCVALGAVSWALGHAVDRAFVWLAPNSDDWLGYGANNGWTRPDLVTVMIAVGLAPLTEEMFFRGVIASGVRAGGSRVLAVLVSAAAFALFHPPAHSAARAFVRGVLLAVVADRTGTVTCAMLVHATSNAIGLAT
jgi:membrane protease YdiL (CAAX protease family)